MVPSTTAEPARDRLAGAASLLAAAAWLAWAVLNAATNGALDGPRSGPNAPWGWLGTGLLVAWTALVIPAAVVLGRWLSAAAPRLVSLATAAGVLSLLLWGGAALGRWWPVGLEPAFLLLSAGWWLGIGKVLRQVHPRLGTLTLVLGVAAALDAVVTGAGERLPAWMFPVLGGPKLPLQWIWTIAVGRSLWRGMRSAPGPSGRRAMRGHPRASAVSPRP